MGETADFFADEDVPRARVALLLEHFSRLEDDREPWRIVYPLSEVLLLLTCATIASCDDFDEIAAFGHHHLDLLRKFAPYYNGIPCERWLRALVNRIDPETFASCFEDWIRALWPGRHVLIAIDGKTSRRTHDKRKGLKALHTLSAYATNAHLTLAQISVPEKTNEITAIPVLLDHLAERKQLEGALVTRHGSQVNGDFGLTRRCDSLGAPNQLGTPDGQDKRLFGRRGPAQGSRSSTAEAFFQAR